MNENLKIVELRKQLGKTLAEARRQKGLSQLDLALELGLTNYNLISKIENGRENLPARHIPRIAAILGVSQDLFFNQLVEMKKAGLRAEMKRHG